VVCTVVNIHILAFWVVVLCRLGGYHFAGICGTVKTAYVSTQPSVYTLLSPRISRYEYSEGFVGYVAVCMQLIVEVSCHCFTLHVSAYMAIFSCVGYYYSRNSRRNLLPLFFFLYLALGYTLHVVTLLYVSICVFLFYFLISFCCFLHACLSACIFVLAI
jgi:hypothetical protein